PGEPDRWRVPSAAALALDHHGARDLPGRCLVDRSGVGHACRVGIGALVGDGTCLAAARAVARLAIAPALAGAPGRLLCPAVGRQLRRNCAADAGVSTSTDARPRRHTALHTTGLDLPLGLDALLRRRSRAALAADA